MLSTYKKDMETLAFCPSDPAAPVGRVPEPNDRISYVLKAAIDEAWMDPAVKAQKETDYRFPAEQLLFYERASFHWGGDPISPGGKAGASFNVCYFDGHVKTVRLADPEIEPDYYNYDPSTGKSTGKREIDPRLYADKLH